MLLVIPGGAGHPMGLDGMTGRLAEQFTVATYDPTGLAHGRLGEPVEDRRVTAWSDGALRVLDALVPDGEAAYVLGSSSGGIAALDLALGRSRSSPAWWRWAKAVMAERYGSNASAPAEPFPHSSRH